MNRFILLLLVLAASSALQAAIPSVTVNQAGGQGDPTNASPVVFTAVFSEAVSGFTDTDVAFTGSTVGGTLAATVSTADNITWTINVTGMSGTGTVVASIPAAVCVSVSTAEDNTQSTSTDNTVTFDNDAPSVTVNQAGAQADPTNAATINFTATFSETVTGFTSAGVTIGGTATGTLVANVTGSGTTYNVAISGMLTSGTVIVTVNASAAQDAAGNNSTASTSTDNTVTFDNLSPDVTINQGSGQSDPTSTSPIVFDVVFTEVVTGFASGSLSFTGSTAGGTLSGSISGSGTTYTVSVSGMTTSGTVIVSINPNAAQDAAGNFSAGSTSTDNSVQWNAPPNPTVTINQAVAQADPTNGTTINFTVVFSEAVSGFATGDVTLSGTAGATTGTVTGGPTTYNVAVTGMTGPGTVIAAINAGVCTSVATTQPNLASTSTDNTVTFDNVAPTVTVNQAVTQTDPTSTAPINFRVQFSESVTGFASGDIAFTGSTAGGTLSATITGGPSDYNVAVSGMTTAGSVIIIVATGAASDAAGNTSTAPTNTDNQVQWNGTGGSGTITVVTPNGGEVRIIGQGSVISWTNGGGFSGNVSILLSTDGGGTFPITVATNITNTGSFAWTVPNNPSATCRIRVQAAAGGSPSDDSNANFTIQAGTLSGVVADGYGASGSQTAYPGNQRPALHFIVSNDPSSPAAFTVTSVRVTIATNDNTSNNAISRLAGVRLWRGNNTTGFGGTQLETITNGGTGWSVFGTTITVTFGSVTPLAVNVNVGQQQDFWVQYLFTSLSVVGTPEPSYSCRIDNTAGTALNGGGTSNYPGIVQGGSVTLSSTIPGDPLADEDKDDDSCELAAKGSPAWPMFALLAVVAAMVVLGRRARREA